MDARTVGNEGNSPPPDRYGGGDASVNRTARRLWAISEEQTRVTTPA